MILLAIITLVIRHLQQTKKYSLTVWPALPHSEKTHLASFIKRPFRTNSSMGRLPTNKWSVSGSHINQSLAYRQTKDDMKANALCNKKIKTCVTNKNREHPDIKLVCLLDNFLPISLFLQTHNIYRFNFQSRKVNQRAN